MSRLQHGLRAFPPGSTITPALAEDAAPWYRNDYRCECGEEWSDEWSCMCNDRCPGCNKEIEPHHSEELRA